MQHAQHRIEGFDGIRAVAVLLVYIEHRVIPGFGLGALGVYLFFCLSGYLITGILHRQRLKIEAGLSVGRTEMIGFWKRRAGRIYPAYYLALVVMVVVYLATGQAWKLSAYGMAWYFALSSNLYIEFIKPEWNELTHLWSLAVEQHFYMLASPLLLYCAARRHATLLTVALVLSLAGIGVAVASGVFHRALYVSSTANFSMMAAGGLLAICTRERASKAHLWIFAGAFTFAALIAHTGLKSFFPGATHRATMMVIGLVMGVSLLHYVTCRQDSRLVRLLETRWLKQLGVISYGFYIVHALMPAIYLPKRTGVLVHFALCVALSAASYHWYERRFLRREAKARAEPPGIAPAPGVAA